MNLDNRHIFQINKTREIIVKSDNDEQTKIQADQVNSKIIDFQVESGRTQKNFYLTNSAGVIMKMGYDGNVTNRLDTRKRDPNSKFLKLIQVTPFHAYVTTRDISFFSMATMKVTVECPLLTEDIL